MRAWLSFCWLRRPLQESARHGWGRDCFPRSRRAPWPPPRPPGGHLPDGPAPYKSWREPCNTNSTNNSTRSCRCVGAGRGGVGGPRGSSRTAAAEWLQHRPPPPSPPARPRPTRGLTWSRRAGPPGVPAPRPCPGGGAQRHLDRGSLAPLQPSAALFFLNVPGAPRPARTPPGLRAPAAASFELRPGPPLRGRWSS